MITLGVKVLITNMYFSIEYPSAWLIQENMTVKRKWPSPEKETEVSRKWPSQEKWTKSGENNQVRRRWSNQEKVTNFERVTMTEEKDQVRRIAPSPEKLKVIRWGRNDQVRRKISCQKKVTKSGERLSQEKEANLRESYNDRIKRPSQEIYFCGGMGPRGLGEGQVLF